MKKAIGGISAFIIVSLFYLGSTTFAFANGSFVLTDYQYSGGETTATFGTPFVPSSPNFSGCYFYVKNLSDSTVTEGLDDTCDSSTATFSNLSQLSAGTYYVLFSDEDGEPRNSQNFSVDSNGNWTTESTPTPAVQIVTDPASSTVSVGTPFNVDVKITDNSSAFNAAQATVAHSSNLSVTGIHNATSGACNLQYTKHPTHSNPSFAGAIFGGSSTGCTVYTMTLTPTSTGAGTITFSNASIKAYSDSSDILTGVVNGSYTIAAGPTPTPTSGVPQLTVTSPLLTYLSSYTLAGTKDSAITHVFINSSESGVSFPISTTWQATESLSLGTGNIAGDNNFTIYGSDDDSNQTATQTVDVSRHILADINGDGNADLTDLSILAKLE